MVKDGPKCLAQDTKFCPKYYLKGQRKLPFWEKGFHLMAKLVVKVLFAEERALVSWQATHEDSGTPRSHGKPGYCVTIRNRFHLPDTESLLEAKHLPRMMYSK